MLLQGYSCEVEIVIGNDKFQAFINQKTKSRNVVRMHVVFTVGWCCQKGSSVTQSGQFVFFMEVLVRDSIHLKGFGL